MFGHINRVIDNAIRESEREAEQRRLDDANRESERKAEEQTRAEFLASIRAVQTPSIMYAAWVAVYIEQGGEVRYVTLDRNYTTPMKVFGGGFGVGVEPLHEVPTPDIPDYRSNAYDKWMPTQWPANAQIPTGYGASSMEILIPVSLFPDTRIHLRKATDDDRQGWEWGHTEVMVLQPDSNGPWGLRATVNDPDYKPVIYADTIEDLERLKTAAQIREAVFGQNRLPAPRKHLGM